VAGQLIVSISGISEQTLPDVAAFCTRLDERGVPASFLVAGQNTLAIRAQDRGGQSYVDADVTAPVPAPPAP